MTPHAREMRWLGRLERYGKTWAKNRAHGLLMRQRREERDAFRAQVAHQGGAFVLALGLGLAGYLGRVALAGVLG